MIYTAKEGVERKFREKILTAELIIVPLIMFGVTAYGLVGSPGSTGDFVSPDDSSGVTLGTNTDITDSGQDNGLQADTQVNGAANTPAGDSSTTAAAQTSSSSKPAAGGQGSTSQTPPSEGGRGGGTDEGGSSCPCETVGDVLETLIPPVPPPPAPLQNTVQSTTGTF